MSQMYNWRLPDEIINSLGSFNIIITKYNPDQIWEGRVLVHCLQKSDMGLIPKMISHQNGLMIVYNKTGTIPFQEIISNATGMFVVKGRLRFADDLTGQVSFDNAPYGNIIFSFSEYDNNAIKNSGIMGVFVPLKI